MVNKLVENIKNNLLTWIILLISGVIASIWGLTKKGAEIEFKEKISKIVVEVFDEKMKDQKTIQDFLLQPAITNYVHDVRVESQKEIIQMTTIDSINFKEELRLYMDLRQSEKVSEELAKTYLKVKNMDHIIDSMIVYAMNRRSVHARF